MRSVSSQVYFGVMSRLSSETLRQVPKDWVLIRGTILYQTYDLLIPIRELIYNRNSE